MSSPSLTATPFMYRDLSVHGTAQYSTVQCSTVQYSTVRYGTVRYGTAQYGTAQETVQEAAQETAQEAVQRSIECSAGNSTAQYQPAAAAPHSIVLQSEGSENCCDLRVQMRRSEAPDLRLSTPQHNTALHRAQSTEHRAQHSTAQHANRSTAPTRGTG